MFSARAFASCVRVVWFKLIAVEGARTGAGGDAGRPTISRAKKTQLFCFGFGFVDAFPWPFVRVAAVISGLRWEFMRCFRSGDGALRSRLFNVAWTRLNFSFLVCVFFSRHGVVDVTLTNCGCVWRAGLECARAGVECSAPSPVYRSRVHAAGSCCVFYSFLEDLFATSSCWVLALVRWEERVLDMSSRPCICTLGS